MRPFFVSTGRAVCDLVRGYGQLFGKYGFKAPGLVLVVQHYDGYDA
jgi:hypothetical protein